MGLPANLPWILILVPVGLLALDVIYKWSMFGRPPYDSVADMALAALTFGAVHLLTNLVQATGHPTTVPAMAVVWVLLQFGAWPAALLWSRRLEKMGSGVPWLSYLAGGIWFTYGTGQVLTLVQ